MAEKFHRELRLKKEDAAAFLRELADSIEDEKQVMIQGGDWKLYQPYEDTIPFQIIQDDTGLEIDLKMISPEEE